MYVSACNAKHSVAKGLSVAKELHTTTIILMVQTGFSEAFEINYPNNYFFSSSLTSKNKKHTELIDNHM
jgi:hypothetical protein